MVKSVLVVECQSSLDWGRVFEGAHIASTGEPVEVVQSTFPDMSLVSYGDGPLVVSRRSGASFTPDFVLLRSISHGIRGQDSRNLLYGLSFSGVPCINSAESEILALERPVVFGQLRRLRNRMGQDAFPLIAASFYPAHSDIVVTPDFPCVAKVGHAHAGAGKIKLADSATFADFKSLVALHSDYTTVEPFVDWDWDGRVQRIGPGNVRVFKRVSQSWKGNTAHSSVVSDAPVEPWHRMVAEECSKLLGGIDILGLDLLHPRGMPEDKAVILELNTTAIGLVHDHEAEDMAAMRDLVLARMETLWGEASKQAALAAEAPSSSASLSEVEVLRAQLAKAREDAACATDRARALEEELAKERAKKKPLFSF